MLIRYFFTFLFTLSLLIAATDSERLESAKVSLNSSDEIEQFRGYNECKTLYTKAISSKNNTLAKESLEGIIKGGELLKIDVTRYKAELTKLSPAIKSTQPVTLTSTTPVAVVPQESKPLVFPKEYVKSTPPPSAIKTINTQSNDAAIKPSELFKSTNEIATTKRHRLINAQWNVNGIELTFDTPIDPKEVQLSKIIESDKQRFRYIIDIEDSLIVATKVLEHEKFKKVRIAQYDSNTLRMVIEHNEAIAIKPSYKGSLLSINLGSQGAVLAGSTPLLQPTPSPAVEPPIIQPPLAKAPPPIIALPPIQPVTPRDRSKKVIVIDPGHGGKDSGAVGNGHMEKEIVLQISLTLAEQLRELGYTVYLTRSNDTFIELKDRTHFANDKSADLFLSVHANAIPKGADVNAAYGIETYFLSPGRSERAMRVAALENSDDMGEMGQYGKLSFLSVLNSEKIIASNKLAIDIQKGVLNSLRKQYPNVKDNGAREAPFWVLVGAQMPAILLETGYISHPEESARIADSKYQKWMVDGMVDGIKHYFANNP